MSVATRSLADALERALASPEERIVVRGVSWEEYQRFVEERGDHSRVLLAYDRGDLELMSPGLSHEVSSRRMAWLLETMADELDLAFNGYASARWESPATARGIESDQCYYLTVAKIAAARARGGGIPEVNDSEGYPKPDLVVEIDISRSRIGRPSIYSALRVPEVWRFDGKSIRIDRLQHDGTYATAPESQFFPIRPEELLDPLFLTSEDEKTWRRQTRAWVRAVVVPRRPANPGI